MTASRRPAAPSPASLKRRLLSLVYEALLLAIVVMVGSLPFVAAAGALDLDRAVTRPLFQIYLLSLTAAYFIWQWRRGGQTLAMKTWRIRLVARDGAPLTRGQCVRRFVFAAVGLLLAGIGFAWALVDRDRQFLHDRLAGTRIVSSEQ